MQKPASPHASLIFIFGSLNFKSPQKINTVVTLSVFERKKSIMCFGVLQSWMNNDLKKKRYGLSTKYLQFRGSNQCSWQFPSWGTQDSSVNRWTSHLPPVLGTEQLPELQGHPSAFHRHHSSPIHVLIYSLPPPQPVLPRCWWEGSASSCWTGGCQSLGRGGSP